MNFKFKWIIGIFAIALLATAFIPAVKENVKTKPTQVATVYYWFDAATLTFLRTNTLDDEYYLTGYDPGQYNPKTKREKGYTISQLRTINPPTVYSYTTPSVILYSHP